MSHPRPSPVMDDPARFGRVAVLAGGDSAERAVSLDSGRNVLQALQACGVDAELMDGVATLRQALVAGRVDRVFNVLHGGAGENGVLQGLLEAWGVPCTGSGVLGSALAMDKVRSKQVWEALGLPTPAYRRIPKGADVEAAARQLGFPVILKPSCEGSSVGVSRVFEPAELAAAVALAQGCPGELLMERLIRGEGPEAGEYTVGILDGAALPSIRIIPASAYYDYHAKYVAEDTRYQCPGLSGEAEDQIKALALAAFEALGCSGWGRVDVMRDDAGRNYLLEVNTAPGMTSHSLVPKAARQIGMDFPMLCWSILETSLHPEKGERSWAS